MARQNPIEQRLEVLLSEWSEFCEHEQARLLIWQAKADELSMIEAFFAKECDEDTTEAPDFFVRLQAPFTHAGGHGFALAEALIAQYEEARPEMEKAQLEAGWKPPRAAAGVDEKTALIRTLHSFYQHHAAEVPRLSVWLDADSVEDTGAYLHWLQELVHAAPAALRFFIVDCQDALLPLIEAVPQGVLAIPCNLDMPGAMGELAAADAETPGGRFRAFLVKIGGLAGAGDVAAAEALSAPAQALALAQGWPHLAALVPMTLASAYTMLQRPLEALTRYAEAEALGAQAEAITGSDGTDAPALYGTRIRLQAKLGQGAILIGQSAFAQAAEVYIQAFALAQTLLDLRSQLDCVRVASVCRERSGQTAEAVELAKEGLTLVSSMDDEMRKTSTAPYLFDHMLRISESHSAYAAHRRPLEEQAQTWFGRGWRAELVQAG